jgi:hypothetical protein
MADGDAMIDRADQQRERLGREMNGFVLRHNYGFNMHFDGPRGLCRITAHVPYRVPNWEGTIIKIAQTLRRALDETFRAMIQSSYGNADESATLPICFEREDFDQTIRGLGLPDEQIAAIEGIQPYRIDPEQPERTAPAMIRRLAEADSLPLRFALITNQVSMRHPPEVEVSTTGMSIGTTLVPDAETATFTWEPRPDLTEGNMEVEIDQSFDVAFDEAGPGLGGPVPHILRGLVWRVRNELLPVIVAGGHDDPPTV